MTSFTNSDGSALAGALNPSGIGQALHVDASGALLVTNAVSAQSLAGQSFTASSGRQTPLASILAGFGIFNPLASGKTVILTSILICAGNTSFNEIRLVTTDPAFGTPLTPVNNRAGSVVASIASLSFVNTNQTPGGTVYDTVAGAANLQLQAFPNGKALVLPPNQGIALFVNTGGTNPWNVSASWSEI